ncbi:hypothetical protein DSO57_1005525 [Entomophthora muscae]|uniref:Uncharacterized protein n=1 Tax=Entomophthora muscae TaxID=34485 RepID=A0ACC2SWX7_9FUNG|nr:hypothetical protein DSO57_1005525 [Entomophthora muscae]
MRGILFLSWFLAYFLPDELALETPAPTTDWYNSSPDDAHQKESLANGWFKYPSGHWGRKFQYGHLFTTPPAEPTLVRPYASFYLLMYLVGYYLLDCFSSMFERFAYLGHLGHLSMVTVPIGLVIAGLNVGVLAHQLGSLFPAKWVPDSAKLIYHLGRRLPRLPAPSQPPASPLPVACPSRHASAGLLPASQPGTHKPPASHLLPAPSPPACSPGPSQMSATHLDPRAHPVTNQKFPWGTTNQISP